MNPQEDDLYNYPVKPEKWTKPIEEDRRKRFVRFNWLDNDGNITEEGRFHGVCQEMLEGTETEEHFQWRMRFWKEKCRIFDEWFSKKWGENGNKPDLKLPYPKQEMRILNFREGLFMNPKENDLYNWPFKPEKWTIPITDSERRRLQDYGWIDNDESITRKGRLNGICMKMLNGTETEEHFQWRIRVWKEECRIFERWFFERYGMDGHESHSDIPYPSEEMRMVKFRVK